MTIIETRMVECIGEAGPDGTIWKTEFEVDFTGAYDATAATAHVTFTPVGMPGPMTISAGAEFAEGAGVYAGKRTVKMTNFSHANVPGTFSITLAFDQTDQLSENPLDRKDVAVFRRSQFSKPISKDRANRVIATYRTFTAEDAFFVDPNHSGDLPLEIFATLPEISTTRLFITVSGYRAGYKLADAAFSSKPDEEFTIVNNAPVTIDGITFKAGTLALLEINARRQKINGHNVVGHDWNLAYSRVGWNHKILNAGNYEWDPSKTGLQQQRIRDKTGAYRSGPWPLDSAGKALPDGFTAGDVVFLNFLTTQPFGYGYFGWNF